MHPPLPPLELDHPLVVGSVIRKAVLDGLDGTEWKSDCDLLEIRLDGLALENSPPQRDWWQAFLGLPLLFTARRQEEGGLGGHDARKRMVLLETALPDAALIDIEAASITEMRPLLDRVTAAGIPWIASYHDFTGVPREKDLLMNLQRAKDAGASVFKWAAMLRSPADLVRLAEFQMQDHGLPVASMGMGPLAVVSRLLCAQCGSTLNYGYLGSEPTAPGQWDAGSLRRAISRMPRI